jgi:hypothetical protein
MYPTGHHTSHDHYTPTRHYSYHQSLDVLALPQSPFIIPIVLHNPELPGIPSIPEGYANDIINNAISHHSLLILLFHRLTIT